MTHTSGPTGRLFRSLAAIAAFTTVLIVAAFVAVSARQTPTHSLMPVPAELQFHPGRVPVDASLRVAITGVSDSRLQGAVTRWLERMQGRTGFVLSRQWLTDPAGATFVVHADAAGSAIPQLGDDESYTIDAAGTEVLLRAPTVVGVMRGLETVLQLVDGDSDGFYIPSVTIRDRPRFAWRGLLIDVGRHFQPVEVIKRNLDGMAAVKLNVLHFHLSEDQGFRVESREFPRLHELGSDGLYYTREDLREILVYARDRGIRVVPEFDMPGHVTSWLVGYPALASAPGPYEISRRWGVMDPAFDPTRDETYKFIDTFIGEMAAIFPDAYWHIGGDENNGKHWAANPSIQAFMAERGMADAHALQTYFNQRLADILKKHGKRMMGWDEILQPGLPAGTVVHSWRGRESLFEAARQGFDTVLSNGYYIDLMRSAATHYAVDPLPADAGLSEADAAHVLGGEATMWGEWVGPETIDSRIWPRTAAIAERFWSPREVADVDDMYRRLEAVSIGLEALDLEHESSRSVLLRRLAGTREFGPLETIADLVEPVEGYQRGRQQPWMTSQGPLTHLVDAVGADSLGARAVSRDVDVLLEDAGRFRLGRSALEGRFADWRDVQPAFDLMAAAAPGLAEITPLASDLAAMGRLGLEALTYLASGTAPSDTWRDAGLAVLDQAARPKAALEFPFLAAMRELVIAAREQGQLGSMSPAEWRQHVRALAAPPQRGRGGR